MDTVTIERSHFDRMMRLLFTRFDGVESRLERIEKKSAPVVKKILDDDPILWVADLGEYFGVTDNTIYRYKRNGKLPLVKFGGKLGIKKSRLEALILGDDSLIKEISESENPA